MLWNPTKELKMSVRSNLQRGNVSYHPVFRRLFALDFVRIYGINLSSNLTYFFPRKVHLSGLMSTLNMDELHVAMVC